MYNALHHVRYMVTAVFAEINELFILVFMQHISYKICIDILHVYYNITFFLFINIMQIYLSWNRNKIYIHKMSVI